MNKKLHKEVISEKLNSLLESINSKPSFEDFYLVGGTALALFLGHRKSIDLDFFSQNEFTTSLTHNIKEHYKVISLNRNSIELEIKGAKILFLYFAFPLYSEKLVFDNIRFASPIDIGLMKLLSLQGRTTKKDIVDLFFIDKEILDLSELLDVFENHYPKESFNSYDSLKNLLDKSFLYGQPDPNMIKQCEFKECLSVVSKKVSKHIRKLVF